MGNYIFFLLMGYFYQFGMDGKKKIRKIVKLAAEVYFYALVAVVVFAIPYLSGTYKYWEMGTRGIIKTIVSMILPLTSEVWWFITTYLFIFILLGALDVLDRISKKKFFIVLAVLFLANLLRMNSGSYNKIFQNIFVVLVGIYIRKFAEVDKREKIRYIYEIVCIVAWILSGAGTIFFYKYHLAESEFFMRSLSSVVNKGAGYSKMIFAICALLLCVSLDIKHSENIGKIAASTFGVYLFHGSPFFVYFVFMHLGFVSNAYNMWYFPIVFCLTVAGIFACAYMLDLVQKWCSKRVTGFVIERMNV